MAAAHAPGALAHTVALMESRKGTVLSVSAPNDRHGRQPSATAHASAGAAHSLPPPHMRSVGGARIDWAPVHVAAQPRTCGWSHSASQLPSEQPTVAAGPGGEGGGVGTEGVGGVGGEGGGPGAEEGTV